jgi:hypothetical protein
MESQPCFGESFRGVSPATSSGTELERCTRAGGSADPEINVKRARHVNANVMPQNRTMNATPNPYDPPGSDAACDSTAVPTTRLSLARLIQSFLDSDITAFEFDEQLDPFRESDDPVINHVVDAVWFHYDDCDDHLVCFTKQQWDYFQRLLLVLSSDCRIETHSQRRWSVRQLIAVLTLCAFVYFAFQLGWGQHLLIVSIPFGLVSIALSFWRHRDAPVLNPYAPVIFPFATFSDLATAYHSTGFRKTRYPRHIGTRTIRSPFMARFWQLHTYTIWLILSPIPLLFQSLPDRQTETRVIAA